MLDLLSSYSYHRAPVVSILELETKMKSVSLLQRIFIYSGLGLLTCTCAPAQQKDTNNVRTAPAYVRSQPRSDKKSHLLALTVPAGGSPGPVCANTPVAADLKPFGHFAQMSVQDAASLNLSFGPFDGSGSWSQQSQVIVWRQGKIFTCPSTDGKYNVVYGAEWDSAIAISQTSLTGKASFATIAANVQLNNSSTTYDYVGAGYTNTTAWETANGTLLKDISTNGLSVTNYSTFDTDFGATLTAANAMTPVDPPRVIGYAPIGTADVSQSLAKGYAIMFIAKGRGCQDAEDAFPIKEAWVDSTIRSVYLQMSNGKSDCDGKADPNEQAIAAQLLNGIDIEKP
jgi:hypothetical protein